MQINWFDQSVSHTKTCFLWGKGERSGCEKEWCEMKVVAIRTSHLTSPPRRATQSLFCLAKPSGTHRCMRRGSSSLHAKKRTHRMPWKHSRLFGERSGVDLARESVRGEMMRSIKGREREERRGEVRRGEERREEEGRKGKGKGGEGEKEEKERGERGEGRGKKRIDLG